MAKSLRSKTKVRFRAIKRTSVFGQTENERAERLARRAQENLEKQNLTLASEEVQKPTEEVTDEIMEVDDKKISTSGWKGSRNDSFKKKQAKKRRANLVFRSGKKSKSKK
jgi:predicted phage gp36 major capsid-like protein